MSRNTIDSFDVSKKQMEVIEYRNARRKVLREDYLKQIHNPIKQELLMDHGIHRFGIMRIANEYHSAINGRCLVVGIGGTLAAIGIFYLIAKNYKNKIEHQYRTGQIAYADRHNKFM
ncbi:NADH dehydrogenase (ubiquinone) B15 subunit [Nomia melanderi]|uniref:NADH dehydrogenase (ubiquinone) B15 subunit n=1 Tax=Nomia melanderi TaxID=2448451 RepID=UPI0013042EA9|nr:uncharacterized protein LOC116424670 [Nomia melanderi]